MNPFSSYNTLFLPKTAKILADLAASPDCATGNVLDACKEFCLLSDDNRNEFIFRFREALDIQFETLKDLRKNKF